MFKCREWCRNNIDYYVTHFGGPGRSNGHLDFSLWSLVNVVLTHLARYEAVQPLFVEKHCIRPSESWTEYLVRPSICFWVLPFPITRLHDWFMANSLRSAHSIVQKFHRLRPTSNVYHPVLVAQPDVSPPELPASALASRPPSPFSPKSPSPSASGAGCVHLLTVCPTANLSDLKWCSEGDTYFHHSFGT